MVYTSNTAKRVFFSFHYDDVKTFRANVVRNSGLLKETDEAGFFDASIWEDAKLNGESSIKRLINANLENTSITCVLIGTHTWSRRWVRYEIMKSYDRGNKLMGININSIKDKNNQIFKTGANPFNYLGFYIDSDGKVVKYQEKNDSSWINYKDLTPSLCTFDNQYRNKGYVLSSWVPVFDWNEGNGYENFSSWIEKAR